MEILGLISKFLNRSGLENSILDYNTKLKKKKKEKKKACGCKEQNVVSQRRTNVTSFDLWQNMISMK